MADVEVSVVVAARNAEAAMVGLLDALAGQSFDRRRFEVLLVDDASSDRTADIAGGHGVARVIRLEHRGGSYAARNAGLAAARGTVVAITDADCLPAPGWLEAGVAALESTEADLAGGRVEMQLSARAGVAETVDAAHFLDQRRSVASAGYAVTANLFVRRAVFDAVGPFDARLMSGGDVEFCTRATRAGFALVYADAAQVVHPARGRPRELLRKSFRVGRGMGVMRREGIAPWDSRSLPWRRVGAYRPVRGAVALERLGSVPRSRLRLLMLDAGQYLLVHLPMLAGQAAGELRARDGGGRRK